MADGLTFELEGLDNVLDTIATYPARLQRSAVRKSARAAANVMRDAARENAKKLDDPESRERIWKNIVTQESGRRSRQVGGAVMRVGVRGGAKRAAKAVGELSGSGKGNPGGDTWYWRLVEFGTEHSSAKPFMRPAMKNNVTKAEQVFAATLSDEIDKLAP